MRNSPPRGWRKPRTIRPSSPPATSARPPPTAAARPSCGHACTAQNGAHWSRDERVPTCTQHCTSRSSIMVDISMKGLTVIRTTRSPSSRLSWRRRPGNAVDATVSKVAMPRSQFSQIMRHTSDIAGCDNEDCSDSNPSSDSRTASRNSRGTSRSAIRLAISPSLPLRLSWPISATSERHCPLSSRSRYPTEQQCGCEHGSAVKSRHVIKSLVCGPNRFSTPV